MVHSQVTRRIDNQSLIINRNGFVFEFLTPSKRIERLDENNSSLLSDHIHIHPCAPINPIVYSSVIRFRRRRKKKKSHLLLFEKLGNKKEKKVRYPLVGTKLGFAYAVANRETLALLFLDIHIPPIPIPIFFSFSFLQIVFARVSRRVFNANLFKDTRFQNNILDYSISTKTKRVLQIIELVYCIKTFKKINVTSISLNSVNFFLLILLIHHELVLFFDSNRSFKNNKSKNIELQMRWSNSYYISQFFTFIYRSRMLPTYYIKHISIQSFYSIIFKY